MSAVEALHLRREWPQPKGAPVVAVDDATFAVEPGEVLGLLGPNGAGKTTLMQMLVTLTPPTSGTATICGHDVRAEPHAARAKLGYLSTTSGLPSRVTVRECLTLFARLHRLAHPVAATGRAVDRFTLGSFADRFVEGLSTGMRQRVRIACAAIHAPPVLILDEPTAGLDLMSTDDLLAAVAGLRADGAAVIYSTHIMEEAERLCDRVAVLHEGRLRAVDTLAGLYASTGQSTLAGAFRAVVRR